MKRFITINRLIASVAVVLLVIIWHIVSVHAHSEYLVPSPLKTLTDLARIIISENFLHNASSTIIRGLGGFVLSFVCALFVGILSGMNEKINAFFSPVIIILRSVPVIAFILLAIIWFSSDYVPVFIAFLTMFPLLCSSITEGIRDVRSEYVQLAKVYHVPILKSLRSVYIPSMLPYFFVGASNAMGFGWRAIIIGEVLSRPRFGIGNMMQNAQTYLLVSELIAWTIIAVAVSFIFEKAIQYIKRISIYWK